jgi:hypothetical protein
MREDFFDRIEVCMLTAWSYAALSAAIRRGEFPAATHRLRGRHLWAADAVRNALERLGRPVPIGAEAKRRHVSTTATTKAG